MKRRAVSASVIGLVVFAIGVSAAVATHTSVTEEHVVPFTVGTVTGEVTITDTDALPHETVTVTETVTETTEPPPPPPPPPTGFDGDCKRSNYQEWLNQPELCNVGSVLNVPENTQWRCPPVPATEFPVRVAFDITGVVDEGDQGYVFLGANCRGDTDPDTVDYIIDARGVNFPAVGFYGGIGKFQSPPGPTGVTVTGWGGCGPRGGGAHQDGWQFHPNNPSGDNAIVNFQMLGFDTGFAQCAGAGGAVFWSDPADIDILGGRFISCNHGLNGNAGRYGDGNVVKDAVFRINNQGAACSGVVQTVSCLNVRDLTLEDVVCERRVGDSWQTQPPQD